MLDRLDEMLRMGASEGRLKLLWRQIPEGREPLCSPPHHAETIRRYPPLYERSAEVHSVQRDTRHRQNK